MFNDPGRDQWGGKKWSAIQVIAGMSKMGRGEVPLKVCNQYLQSDDRYFP